jgi:serine/threonine protein kinase
MAGARGRAGYMVFKPNDRHIFLCCVEASEIMKSIGEAIQYLHSINIAHRDVKVPAVYTAC